MTYTHEMRASCDLARAADAVPFPPMAASAAPTESARPKVPNLRGVAVEAVSECARMGRKLAPEADLHRTHPQPAAAHYAPARFLPTGTAPGQVRACPGDFLAGTPPARMTAAQREETARRMQALMALEDITVVEAGARFGLSAKRSHLLSQDFGFRSSAASVQRARGKGLAAITDEQARAGRAKAYDTLRTHRLQLAAEGHARRAVLAEKLREHVDAGLVVTEAARRVGIRVQRAYEICKQFGIRSNPSALLAAQSRNGLAGSALTHKVRRAKGWGQPAPKPVLRIEPIVDTRKPNPKMTAAQQANVDRVKAKFWHPANNALAALPQPTRAEADALVAAFIAARGVTVCPPKAAAPINNGEGFER